jgi:FkbM family methyltransferase
LPFEALKFLLPDRPVLNRVWRGPFRGARIVMNPRNSLRKILGLYEHELNNWLEQALRRVTRVLDVGANDGYFTFGCAAAFRRLSQVGEIMAFEPDERCVALLRESLAAEAAGQAADTGRAVRIEIIRTSVGSELKPGTITLDSLVVPRDKTNTLVKIDVDGPEVDVIQGSRSWLVSSNLFVIEVHEQEFIAQLRSLFAERNLRLVLLNQRPLPVLGRERRPKNNCWLVSELGTSKTGDGR